MTDRTLRQEFGDFKKSIEGLLIKQDLLTQQLFLCPICKRDLSQTSYHIDHIIPLVLLENKRDYIQHSYNLQILCKKCNLKKSFNYHGNVVIYLFGIPKLCLININIYPFLKSFISFLQKFINNKVSEKSLKDYKSSIKKFFINTEPWNLEIEDLIIDFAKSYKFLSDKSNKTLKTNEILLLNRIITFEAILPSIKELKHL